MRWEYETSFLLKTKNTSYLVFTLHTNKYACRTLGVGDFVQKKYEGTIVNTTFGWLMHKTWYVNGGMGDKLRVDTCTIQCRNVERWVGGGSNAVYLSCSLFMQVTLCFFVLARTSLGMTDIRSLSEQKCLIKYKFPFLEF